MSPKPTIFTKPPPSLNHHPKSNHFLHKTLFSCPPLCTKVSSIIHTKSVRFEKTMASVSMESRFISCGDSDKSIISPTISAFEQESLINNNSGVSHIQTQTVGCLHTLFNRSSKWVVGVTFGGFIILRHDDLALWAAVGSISNYILSITLKRILKQDRPVSEVSSGHGMPSSHAQTVFFTLVFVIISVIETLGMNRATSSLAILLVALGSYLSWLRVLLGYHTISQVIAGIVVGSNFAVLWFWAWKAVVSTAYNSNPWVQDLLFVGHACYYLGFMSYVLWHWIKG